MFKSRELQLLSVVCSAVPDVSAAYPENYILGNVRGVIGDALEIACDQQNVQRLPCAGRIVVHLLHQVDERLIFHAINDAIHLQHGFGDFGLTVEEGLQRTLHHRAHAIGHAGYVDRQTDLRLADQVEHALRDVYRLVADALEISVDLQDCENEAKIHRHRLLHGEQIERQLVDLALGIVDRGFAGQHHLTELAVARTISLRRTVDGLLRKASHAQELLFEVIQSLLKAASHYPNLPVT